MVERHALKDQACQPKPDPLGAAQVVPDEKMETALNASCSQSGQGAVFEDFLKCLVAGLTIVFVYRHVAPLKFIVLQLI